MSVSIFFFFYGYGDHRDLHSFPTRRSSDLVDDLNPIEAGRLRDGSPDLYFRGFYCWNSEVGAKTLGMASFNLRAVCQNRNLWGDRKSTRLNSSHVRISYAVFCLKKKNMTNC